MHRFEVLGLVELNGAGCPAVYFRLTVPADDETQARAAVQPLLARWPHLVLRIERADHRDHTARAGDLLRGVFPPCVRSGP